MRAVLAAVLTLLALFSVPAHGEDQAPVARVAQAAEKPQSSEKAGAVEKSGTPKAAGKPPASATPDGKTKSNGTPENKGPLSPKDALAHLVVPNDLEITQVLAEPVVAQPVFLDFDERGRMWVVQYLQYPNPAGLKLLSRDKFWRSVYDKQPPAPPHHFRGLDKITIHEDTDGDGTFDKHKTFVDGLNIVTACAVGRGGVWVLNPPYLLFYPDRDHDDLPDADPEVHLEGFGLEDTHSVVNSLCWGPDGWLYATQGSTVTGNVRRPGLDKQPVRSMGQLVWRYHPESKRYEIFAEGGGNAFGLEIDSLGRAFSGHNGGDTRGFHYVQGGYSQKGFTKHGPLSNPFAFGFFPPMRHHAVQRFTHTFIIYEADALPPAYHGKLFGVAPMLSHVVLSDIFPDGSTFQTRDIGHAVTSKDSWFRPVDIKVGPDGNVYIADWYDSQVTHFNNHQGQLDTTNGRIYRLSRKRNKAPAENDDKKTEGTDKDSEDDEESIPTTAIGDLAGEETEDLITLLSHPNKWFRRTALRLLGDRKDAATQEPLKTLIHDNEEQLALEALWALHLSGGLDDAFALETLVHPNPYVRLWTVRLLADERRVAPTISPALAKLAEGEPHVEVRSQLAASARRLPAADALPILRQLMKHDADTGDPQVPLLIWWGLESKCDSDREQVLALFQQDALWQHPLVSGQILPRLMRRFASTGQRKDLLTCARLFELAPDAESAKPLVRGFEEASRGRSLANLPPELVQQLTRYAGSSPTLALRQGDPQALDKALQTIADNSADRKLRQEFVEILAEAPQPQAVPVLLKLLDGSDPALLQAALTALLPYPDDSIAAAVLDEFDHFSPDSKVTALALLASRKAWAVLLADAVDAGKLPKEDIPLDLVRRLTVHRDAHLAELIQKHWGSVEGATTAEMQNQIESLAKLLHADSGSPYEGKKLFTASCGKCHKLFGAGGDIGPDLTSFQRDNASQMLLSIVNPSAEIREGFETSLIVTEDGRTLSGFLVDQDQQLVVLRTADGQTVSIRRDQIDEMLQQKKSLMPEGLLGQLKEQQVRDLFAYLRSTQPLAD